MAFYVISGFLIVRVFEETYRHNALGFVLNRLLRLYPPFLFVWLASWFAYLYIGAVPVEPGPPNWLPALFKNDTWYLPDLILLPEFVQTSLDQSSVAMSLLGSTEIIPQAWSIEVEMAFYLMPLLALLFGKQTKLVLYFIFSASMYLFLEHLFFLEGDFKDYDNWVYKEVFRTAWLFAFGGLIYFNLSRVRRFISSKMLPLTLVGFAVCLLGLSSGRYVKFFIESSDPGWNWVVFLSVVFVALFVGIIIIMAHADGNGKEPRWSRTLGELSYGIYLNHFLVVWIMNYLSMQLGFHVFGRFHDVGFGINALAISTGMAWITFICIERPLMRIRSFIRKRN
jgi:peptidoglycan/LPS O-acetylase OafA/YrhL